MFLFINQTSKRRGNNKKLWKDEMLGLCCAGSKALLSILLDLADTFHGMDPFTRHFLDNAKN